MKSTLSIMGLALCCIYLATYAGEPLLAIAIFVIAGWGIGGERE